MKVVTVAECIVRAVAAEVLAAPLARGDGGRGVPAAGQALGGGVVASASGHRHAGADLGRIAAKGWK